MEYVGSVSLSGAQLTSPFLAQSEMRQWLIDHGYMKSDAQAKKDEIKQLFRKNYNWSTSKSLAYLTWR